MTKRRRYGLAAITLLLPLSGPVLAQESPLLSALAGTAVPTEELGVNSARGLPDTLNQAVLDSNSVTGSVTGNITNTNAINTNSGLTTVLQNTGNNVLMQTSTIVNVTIH